MGVVKSKKNFKNKKKFVLINVLKNKNKFLLNGINYKPIINFKKKLKNWNVIKLRSRKKTLLRDTKQLILW